MAKLTGKTMDIAQENMGQLRALFPDVFIEGKVDFDKLRQVLGEYVDENREHYSFTWNGKGQALKLAQTPTTGTLRPCKEESKDWDTTQNVYIEGDNLEVLKLLQKSYFNKVKMIYIDPPYNTGNDFVYKDNFYDTIDNYKKITGQVDSEGNRLSTNTESNGRYHTDWLNMMYPRLRLARNLLSEDGVIFISIDDNEVANLKKICDEIFGEGNFIGLLPTIMNLKGNNDEFGFAGTHEYTIVFCKNKNNVILNELTIDDEELDDWESDEIGLFKKGANLKATGVNAPRNKRPNLFYPIFISSNQTVYVTADNKKINENDRELYPITNGQEMSWRWQKNKIMKENYNIIVSQDGDEISLYKKQRALLGEIPTKKPKSILYKPEYSSGNGTLIIKKLFTDKIFTNPKPLSLLKDFLQLGLNKNGIILDFFSGSATTAHAVMQLNAEDGGKRQYIMVQLPEQTDEKSEAYKAGYKNICEIGKERIRRAGEKIKAEKGLLAEGLDIGFKVFKLDSSNIMKWQPKEEKQSLEELKQQLMAMGQVISTDRSELDVVYEIMLKLGYALTSSIEELVFAGKKVYSVYAGALFICLADCVTLEFAKELISYIYIYISPKSPELFSVTAVFLMTALKFLLKNGLNKQVSMTLLL